MPRIRFITDPKLPRDLAHLGYKKDEEVNLSSNQCQRWLRRGVAIIVPDVPARKPAARGRIMSAAAASPKADEEGLDQPKTNDGDNKEGGGSP